MALFAMSSLLFVISFQVSISTWITSPSRLPHDDQEMAVGVWNGKILVLGGTQYPTQLTEIDTATKHVIDLGQTLSAGVSGGRGQYWTQVEHIVYIIEHNVPRFNIYNLMDSTYTTNWMDVIIKTAPGDDGCLASDSEYLYVLGGKGNAANPLTTLQMLRISTRTWISAPPSMNHGREDHACVVHHGYIWVFGGRGSSSLLSVNERISITNILSNIWDDTIQHLTMGLDHLRCAAYYDTIYVLGGNDGSKQDIIHLVDADTGAVTVSADRMPEGAIHHSPIIWDKVLYVFGGFETGDLWAYYSLPTTTSTTASSDDTTTTTAPHSSNPNEYSSFIPTALPSIHRIVSSSSPIDDTSYDALHASLDPSLNPSLHPTLRIRFASTAHYTISITMNECFMNEDARECAIDEHQMNNIVIAVLGESVQILETQIEENEINIRIVIVDEDYALDKDVVADGIKREMVVEHGEVDVTIKEAESEPQETQKHTKFSIWMIIIMGTVIAMIVVLFVGIYAERKKAPFKHMIKIDEMETKEPDTVSIQKLRNLHQEMNRRIAHGTDDMMLSYGESTNANRKKSKFRAEGYRKTDKGHGNGTKGADIIIAAMIEDKIASGVISTRRAPHKVRNEYIDNEDSDDNGKEIGYTNEGR